MKKFLLLMAFFASSCFATDYKMVIQYGPGSQGDAITRIVAEKFHELTGDTIVVENKASINGLVAINYFKQNKDVDLIGLASGVLVSDPATKEMLYKDTDFDPIIYVGTTTFLWVTTPKSNIKTIDDLLNNTPDFVGGNSDTGKVNMMILSKYKQKKMEFVPYKDSPSIMASMMAGDIPAGNFAGTKSILELHKAGKLNIVASGYKEDFVIDGVKIPSLPQKLKIDQFSGFNCIAVRPDIDPARKQKLKDDLWKAVHNPEVRASLKELFVLSDEYDDMKVFNKFIQTQRENVRRHVQP